MTSRGRLLVVGAGWEQRQLLERAIAEGFDVVATGRPDAALGGLVEVHSIDTHDLNGLHHFVVERSVDFVVSDQDDYARYAQAWLADTFEMQGPTLHSVAPSINKMRLRELCSEAEVTQPRYWPIRSIEDARSIEDLKFPIIVKPVDNRGSIGIQRVDRRDQLLAAVQSALAHSASRMALVEDFIDGIVITVDGAHELGGHRILGVASKKQAAGRYPVAMEITYPAQIPDPFIDLVRRRADAVAAVFAEMGASGLTHTEFVFDGRDVWLLESANRGGGVLTSSVIVPAHSGFDATGHLIAEATGIDTIRRQADASGDSVILSFIEVQPGTVREIRCFDDALDSDGVLAGRMSVSAGDHVNAIENALGRAGFLVVSGQTVEEARKRLERARSMIEVVVAPQTA